MRRKQRSKLEAAANEKVLASGRPLEPQITSEPRWKTNQKLDPYKVRPGAYKMVLPPEEEAKLQLVRTLPQPKHWGLETLLTRRSASLSMAAMRMRWKWDPLPQHIIALWLRNRLRHPHMLVVTPDCLACHAWDTLPGEVLTCIPSWSTRLCLSRMEHWNRLCTSHLLGCIKRSARLRPNMAHKVAGAWMIILGAWNLLGKVSDSRAWCLRGVTAGALCAGPVWGGHPAEPQVAVGLPPGRQGGLCVWHLWAQRVREGRAGAPVGTCERPPACWWNCVPGQWIRVGLWAALATEVAGCASSCKPWSVM